MNPSSLKAERERRGWSQSDLAKKLGVGLSTVGRWEQGKSQPYPYHRKKLATLLGKTAQQLGLLPDTDEPREAPPTALRSETATEACLLTDPP